VVPSAPPAARCACQTEGGKHVNHIAYTRRRRQALRINMIQVQYALNRAAVQCPVNVRPAVAQTGAVPGESAARSQTLPSRRESLNRESSVQHVVPETARGWETRGMEKK